MLINGKAVIWNISFAVCVFQRQLEEARFLARKNNRMLKDMCQKMYAVDCHLSDERVQKWFAISSNRRAIAFSIFSCVYLYFVIYCQQSCRENIMLQV